ncbi:MAG: energy-coupling factor transporter transmembrane protein EcfT [Gaiellales bacterium]|nr:MAG: energy-coupling factor transporter transmembrane protein EcfT [Gaiellales bacterium]
MKLAGAVIGQYFPGASVVHLLDPRMKILAAFAYAVALFLVGGYPGLILMAAALAAAVAVARIPARWLLRAIKPIVFLAGFTFIFQLFLRGGEVLASIGPLDVYEEGVRHGAFLAARLVLLVLSSAVLTFTTAPVLLTDGFSRLLSPLGKLRLPAYELSLMMSIALRFIPTLLMELDRIIKAQKARGAEPGRGGLVRRARSVLPVMVPLFVLSFRHADELALAMESRCYRGGRGRTVRRRLKLRARDAVFMVIVAVTIAAALLV